MPSGIDIEIAHAEEQLGYWLEELTRLRAARDSVLPAREPKDNLTPSDLAFLAHMDAMDEAEADLDPD